MKCCTTRKNNEKYSLLFFCLLFLPLKSYALNLGQLNTQVRVLIKDTSTTRQRYTDTQITNLLNEAQRDINSNTWVVQTTTDIALAVNTTYYTLPDDFIEVTRVTYNYINLYETSFAALDSAFQNSPWQLISTPAPPQFYFLSDSRKKIAIYPFISTSTTQSPIGMLHVKYLQQPVDLVNSSDIPFNSLLRLQPYHTLLVTYCAYRVYLIEGEVDKANAYMTEYVSRLKIMMDDTGKHPNYISSFSGPGNSR